MGTSQNNIKNRITDTVQNKWEKIYCDTAKNSLVEAVKFWKDRNISAIQLMSIL